MATAGGTQALQRSETIRVTVGGREGSVRRANLVGALVGKAAAINKLGRSRSRSPPARLRDTRRTADGPQLPGRGAHREGPSATAGDGCFLRRRLTLPISGPTSAAPCSSTLGRAALPRPMSRATWASQRLREVIRDYLLVEAAGDAKRGGKEGPCAPARGPERRGLAQSARHGGGPVAVHH